MDDFGIKYINQENALHLLNALKSKYKISTDWEGKLYYGMTLDWNYKQGTVTISIKKFVSKDLHKFQHQMPEQAEDAPYSSARIQYGAKTKYIYKQEQEPILSTKDKTKIQKFSELFHSTHEQLMLPC